MRNDRILAEVPVSLKRTLTGDGPTITLPLADDLPVDTPQRAELRVRLDQWVKGDVVRLLWDGVEQTDTSTCYDVPEDFVGNPSGASIRDVGPAAWLSSTLRPDEVTRGSHTVKIVLDTRNPHMGTDIVVTNVELLISFS